MCWPQENMETFHKLKEKYWWPPMLAMIVSLRQHEQSNQGLIKDRLGSTLEINNKGREKDKNDTT